MRKCGQNNIRDSRLDSALSASLSVDSHKKKALTMKRPFFKTIQTKAED